MDDDSSFYKYRAIITDVYDGDTCTADIDLGFGIWMRKQKLRLFGIDTPELRGEEKERGIEVRDFVSDIILGQEVIIQSERDKSGKYGRWLATIWIDGVNINQLLLNEGMAEKYD